MKVFTDLDHSDIGLCTGYKSNRLDLCELCAGYQWTVLFNRNDPYF